MMGFLAKLFGGGRWLDITRLDILLDYSITYRCGSAMLQWTDLSEGSVAAHSHLVALIYGRILCVHKEGQAELFKRVGDWSREVILSEGVACPDFSPWILHVGLGGGDHTLWPWYLSTEELPAAQKYTATLRYATPRPVAPNGFWIHLDMSLGKTRVLAPSSALIAIASRAKECSPGERALLAMLLWQMNVYWGSPDRATIGQEAMAFASAVAAMESAGGAA